MWQRIGNFVYLLQNIDRGVCNACDLQVHACKPFTSEDAEAVASKICDLLNSASAQQAAIEALTAENARLREQIQRTAMPVLAGGFEMPTEPAGEDSDEVVDASGNVPCANRAALLELD